jgi:ElaB/YqjD/DUF883 family membrane-anchored ribosome-binding protein
MVLRYPDFLRHIVNRKLSELSSRYKGLLNHTDEIRKLIALAEAKYKFSSFGGDPENLAKYLLSEDFDLVINSFKAANALNALRNILEEAKKAYSDLPAVVDAIDKVLSRIESGEAGGISIIDRLYSRIEEHVKDLHGVLERSEDSIIYKIRDVGTIIFRPSDSFVDIDINTTIRVKEEDLGAVIESLKNVLSKRISGEKK